METYTWTAVIVAVSLQWSAVALAWVNGARRLAKTHQETIQAIDSVTSASTAVK